MSTAPDRLIVYGDDFCSMATSLRRALDEKQVDYEWRDIHEGDPQYKVELKKLARGFLSVPTVIFPDGSVMVEPSASAVMNKLYPQEAKPGLLSRLLNR